MEREEDRMVKTFFKMKEISSQILYFERFFGTEIFDFDGGVYKSKNKNLRIDCSLPSKCAIF